MNAIALPAQLSKVVAQFETESDGVRLAALAAASRILADHGLRWCEVSIVADAPRSPQTQSQNGTCSTNWRDLAAAFSRYPRFINAWEAQFLGGLPAFPRLSQKQSATLAAIATRLRAAGCDL